MRRLFSPPALRLSSRALVAAIERDERSRTDPEVVTAIPARAGRPARATHPAQQRLPRP
jgi:hypothetical protein